MIYRGEKSLQHTDLQEETKLPTQSIGERHTEQVAQPMGCIVIVSRGEMPAYSMHGRDVKLVAPFRLMEEEKARSYSVEATGVRNSS